MAKETYNILDRWSGAIRFTAEIECSPTALPSLKLGLAVKIAVKERADLRGADLRGADLRSAYLPGADLRGADLQGAYFRGADLRGADLQGAYLPGADLQGADLQGAYFRGEKIKQLLAVTQRLYGGYWFYAFELETGGYKIAAGCRWFTDAEYRDHVKADYPRTTRAAETLAILDYFQSRAVSLKAIEAPKAEPKKAKARALPADGGVR